jgi:hypothetical protein
LLSRAAARAQAEDLFARDPNATLTKLRLFGEMLAQRAAAKVGSTEQPCVARFARKTHA